MKHALGAFALIACSACRHETARTPAFALHDVCSVEVAKFEAAVPKAATLAEPSADLRERVRGLVLDRARESGKMRALALSDVASIGAPAVPLIDALLDEKELALGERLSALEVLGAIDTPSSAEALVKRIDLEKYREPRIRTRAALELAKSSSDHGLLRLLSQLKYETDGETVIWIAAALAKHRNYAGLDGLRALAASGVTQEVRADAAAMLVKTAQDAGFADAEALYAAWCGTEAEHRMPHEEPSAILRLEAWHRIASLAEFDLRIVDDARFALSRSSAWVVDLLVAALHDENAYVRLHVVQCLERLGPRARRACRELVQALDEPRIAPAVATALGAIGCSDARDALVQRVLPKYDPELRNAAAAAIGKLEDHDPPATRAALRALLAPAEPLDLRQAAAQSLLALDESQLALPILVDCLTHPGADAGAAETAVDEWLTRSAQGGDASARTILDAWDAAGGPTGETPTAEQTTARRVRRASALGLALERANHPPR